MSRTNKGTPGPGKEYWKSRLHKHGEVPGPYTKKRTHKAERQKAFDLCICRKRHCICDTLDIQEQQAREGE